MNYRQKIVLILLILMLATAVSARSQKNLSAQEALVLALEATGAGLDGGEVQFYAVLNERFLTLAELESIAAEMAELLAVTGAEVQINSGETFRAVTLGGRAATGSRIQLVVQSNPGDDFSLPPQTHVLVWSRVQSLPHFKETVAFLQKKLRPELPRGQFSFYLKGSLAGKKAQPELQKLARTALAAVDAKIVEGMEEPGLISFTAYTPLVKEHLSVSGELFNLNIAAFYDYYLDRTVIWAGFPLIHDPY